VTEDDEEASFQEGGPDPLEEIAKMLSGRAGESMVSDLLRRHVITRLTDEGLIVEVFDIPGAPLFIDHDQPTASMESIALAIAEVFRLASNDIAIQGHIATVPLAVRENPVWERSSARANRVRKLLIDASLSADRMQRVTGFADRKPVLADRLSERNNRLEIILLRDRL
jgi:chemotaxis protein MotB